MTDYNCFVDEIESQATTTSNLTFHYFGILIPSERQDLEIKFKEITKFLGNKKFHPLKAYKFPENKNLCEALTNMIIENQLEVVCFPFVKKWLENPSLEVLRTLVLPDLNRIQFSNYRSMAWYMFIHVLNSFISHEHKTQTVRIIADSDWLRPGEIIGHEQKKLANLENILSTTQKKSPLLGLADHVAYLFFKFKQIATIESGNIKLPVPNRDDYLINEAYKLFSYLTATKKFNNLDLFEWINKQNQSG